MFSVLAAMAPGTGSTGGDSNSAPWVVFVVAGLVILFGLVMIAKPQLQWKMNRWAYKNSAAMEPSPKGLIAVRISGALAVVFGIVFLIIGLKNSERPPQPSRRRCEPKC